MSPILLRISVGFVLFCLAAGIIYGIGWLGGWKSHDDRVFNGVFVIVAVAVIVSISYLIGRALLH